MRITIYTLFIAVFFCLFLPDRGHDKKSGIWENTTVREIIPYICGLQGNFSPPPVIFLPFKVICERTRKIHFIKRSAN